MNLLLRPVAGLVLAGLVLSACSGSAVTPAPTVGAPGQSAAAAGGGAPVASAAPAGGGSAIDPCTLVTEAEATTFLGSDPGPGVSGGTSDQPACAYGASLTLSVQPSAGKTQYDADHGAAAGSGKLTDLTGVGDAAFAFVVANTIGQMEIVKGSAVVTVNIQGDPSLQNITVDRLTTLGATVAGRM
jgi:Protein of unknown function (DUF3558)